MNKNILQNIQEQFLQGNSAEAPYHPEMLYSYSGSGFHN